MHCLACHHRVAAGALCPRCGRRAPARGATDAGPAPTVPGFDVDGLLGAGGFAVVWEARDRHSGRPVAIKVARPGAEARLAREAALLRGAVTPAFGPRWLADGRARDGRRYVAMEHAGRDRLADRMARRDRAPIAAALAEIAAVADAVAAMHAAGLVHRDLKPDNLLLRPGGRACAIDYGLARAIAEPGAPADAPHPTLTATGEALGTPHYMAPELWGGAATAGPAADVYAVAAIAYELLAGHPPFCGDPVAIRHGHATGRPPPIAAACGLPAEVDAVLAVGLAKRPGDRPESAAAFAERLAAAVRAAARTPRTGAARRAGDGRRDGAAAPRPRDPVALVALHSDAPLPRIAAVAAGAGAVVARAGDALAVLAVTAPDTPAARVRAAIALARACVDALAPAGPVVVHAAAARVAGTPRGPRVAGAAVAGAESWHAAAPDAAVAITRDAAALVDADELRPARDGYATPAGVTPPSAPPEPPPLVGCHALLDRAAAALRVLPACAVLAGGRGVGKSRALDALAGRLRDAGATVVRLRARPASGADPEDLARQLARAALDLGADEPADDAALDRAWRAAGADPPPPARAALAYTLGVRGAGDPDVAAVTAAPGALRPALARALAAAVAARASRSPLAVFVDDAHHADPAVLDALDLAAGDRGAQLAVAIAADPALDDVAPRWGARAARCERLVIEPLGDRDARALLRALLRPAARVPDAALAPLCELAGGVPAHLVELARGAHARGAIRRAAAGDGWELAADRIDGGDSATAGPDRLLARVAADARRGLPAPLVGLAELCAVLGAPISPERVAAAIAHLPAGDPLHVLDPAAGIDRLVARGALRGRPPRPRSPLWTRALAATLPPDRARALHAAALAAAGPAPPPRVVARHAAAAGDPARAAAALVALGDAAADRHRYAEAERHYSRALDCAPPPAVALRARAGRGRARYRLQRHAAAVADLAAAERAAAERGDERLAVGLLLERATALDWCQDRAGAAALAEAAWPRARALGDPRLVARAQLALGVARHRAERTGEALALLARAADGARACGDAETRAIALLVLAPALVYAGRDGDAEARFAEAIAACERAGDDFHLAAALTNRMVLWMKRGDPDAAAADLGRCMRIARRLGNPQLERGAAINLGELELWRGRFERARRLAEAARALQRQFVDGFASYEDALLLARIACARGEPGAAEHLAWIRARCDLAGAPPSIGVLLALVERADADRAAGRIDAAAWDALDRRAADAELLHERLEVLTTACATAAAVGAIACARRWLAAARALARDSQLWSARLTALASRLSPKETPRA